ncbi:MAG: hypothetical protein WBS54_01625 [Acidobacteriota bacterium]
MRSRTRGRGPQGFLRAAAAAALLLVALLAVGCVPTAPVVQGKVTAVSADGRQVSVQNESQPGEPAVTFDVAQAEIGSEPAVGDEVRVVYSDRGGAHVALRLMNITRQQELENSGH